MRRKKENIFLILFFTCCQKKPNLKNQSLFIDERVIGSSDTILLMSVIVVPIKPDYHCLKVLEMSLDPMLLNINYSKIIIQKFSSNL